MAIGAGSLAGSRVPDEKLRFGSTGDSWQLKATSNIFCVHRWITVLSSISIYHPPSRAAKLLSGQFCRFVRHGSYLKRTEQVHFPEYSRQKFEEIWLVRLNAAHQEHGLALACLQKVGQEWRAQMHPDDGLVMSEALERESDARAKYIRILRIFADLVSKREKATRTFAR